MAKQYVDVYAHFDTLGNVTPVAMWWDDGRRFEIDKILDVRRAASLRAAGLGTRYTCRILGKNDICFSTTMTRNGL